jgi:hypothetical protein
MNSKNKISFISGLMIPVVIYVVMALLVVYESFSIFPQSFHEIEFRKTIVFYFALLLLVAIVVFIIIQFKSGKKYLGYGLSLSSLFLVYIVFRLGENYFTNFVCEKPFNKQEWISAKNKPFNMAKTIFKQNELVGLPRKEIIQKLGFEEEIGWAEGLSLSYSVENEWVLLFDLKNDTVVKIEFRERGFEL